jgi:cysteinyl-tRNA synthetase
MDYSPDAMDIAVNQDKKFNEFFLTIQTTLRSISDNPQAPEKWTKDERDLLDQLFERKRKVHKALCDNLDTPEVIKILNEVVDVTNLYLRSHVQHPNGPVLRTVAQFVTDMMKIFGMIDDKLGYSVSESGDYESNVKPLLDAFALFRDQVRTAARDKKLNESGQTSKVILKECDNVRDKVLPMLGVRLEDNVELGKGIWKLADVKTLLKEMERKKQEQKEKNEARLKELEIKENNAREKYEKSLIAPKDLYKDEASLQKYSEWNEDGIPTVLKEENKPVSNSQTKNFQKAQKQQEKLYAESAKHKATWEKAQELLTKFKNELAQEEKD